MRDKKMETRSYTFEIRTSTNEEGRGILEGRPIVYDRETDLGFFRERIEPGALNKTDLRDVRFLVNHDTNMIPLARSRNNNESSTMQLFVDEDGMRIRVKLDIEHNSQARNLYSAVERGDIDGMSFMFSINGQEWEDLKSDSPLRRITDIASVIEVSAVTFPAYEETEIHARCVDVLESARATLESVPDPLESERRALDIEKERQLALVNMKKEEAHA